jgi:zinc transporter 1/2/3
MDSLLIQKLGYALIIFIASIVSGLLPLLDVKSSKPSKLTMGKEFIVGEALASGIFLGAALLHMLNDAARDFYSLEYEYPIAYLLAGIVFLTLLLLEHIGREVNEHAGNNNLLFVLLTVVMMSIHALFEGIALGTRSDLSLLIIMFVAIIGHKWAESYSLAVQFRKNNIDKKLSWFLFLIFALMTPFGIFLGNLANSDNLTGNHILAPIFTSLAAGTFLYIGTLHGLNRAVMVERCCNLRDYMFVILGFSLMAIIGIWI